MNKLGIVLGVAAVATLAGCKDPEYARIRPDAQNQAKSIETKPAEDVAKVDEVKVDEVKADEIKTTEVKDEAPKCKCAPGTKHDKPCECGAADCQCVVEVKPVEPEYTVYIVQRGDYLAKISKKYNIKVDAIKKLNNMTTDNIRLGQKLKLPGKVEVGAQEVPAGAVKAAPAKKAYESYKGATKEYVVVAGDSLGKIAYSNGMNIRQLKELNGLTKDTVYVGQKLKIADKGAVAAPALAKTETKAVAPVVPAKVEEAKVEAPAEAKVEAPVEAKADEAKVEVPADAAAAAAPVAEAAASAEGTTNYVVQDGDDLPTIAIEFRVPVARLRELNNLGEGDEVKAGQVLKIPAEQ